MKKKHLKIIFFCSSVDIVTDGQGHGGRRTLTDRMNGSGSWLNLLRGGCFDLWRRDTCTEREERETERQGERRTSVRQTRLRRGKGKETHFVVSPRNHDILHATSRLVHPVRSRVDGMGGVRVGGKGLRVDVLVGEFAAHDERVLDHEKMRMSGCPDVALACTA